MNELLHNVCVSAALHVKISLLKEVLQKNLPDLKAVAEFSLCIS
jgi:hypothetical protein